MTQPDIDNVRVVTDVNSLPVRNPGSKNHVSKSESPVFGNFDVNLARHSKLKPLLPNFQSQVARPIQPEEIKKLKKELFLCDLKD